MGALIGTLRYLRELTETATAKRDRRCDNRWVDRGLRSEHHQWGIRYRQWWGWNQRGQWRGGQTSELGGLVARGRSEHLGLRLKGIEGHHGGCEILEGFDVEDRRDQWLVSNSMSQRRVECSFPAHLKGKIFGGLGYPTQEHLPVAETLDDVQS